MPFNPTLPATNSEMRSEEMRNQFNGLKELIASEAPTNSSDLIDRWIEARFLGSAESELSITIHRT